MIVKRFPAIQPETKECDREGISEGGLTVTNCNYLKISVQTDKLQITITVRKQAFFV